MPIVNPSNYLTTCTFFRGRGHKLVKLRFVTVVELLTLHIYSLHHFNFIKELAIKNEISLN